MQFPLVALGTQAAGLLQYLAKPAGAPGTQQTAEPFSLAADSSHPWEQLLARYDLRRITPRQFAELIQELRRGELISSEEYQLLAGLRLELDQTGHRADQPLDLVQYLEDRLREAQRDQLLLGEDPAEKNAQAQVIQRRLLWAQRFEQLRARRAAQ